MRKELLSVYLEPAQLAELRRINAATKVPTAALIREAVEMWLKERKQAETFRRIWGEQP